MSHKKFGPDRFSRFDVYWKQTNRQTDKHHDKPNLYIDRYTLFLIKCSRQATATIRANNSAGELCGGVPEDSMHLLRSATPGV